MKEKIHGMQQNKIPTFKLILFDFQAFSGNSQQTIRAKDPSRESEIGRVYAKELSFTDVEIVNRMYNCVHSPGGTDYLYKVQKTIWGPAIEIIQIVAKNNLFTLGERYLLLVHPNRILLIEGCS